MSLYRVILWKSKFTVGMILVVGLLFMAASLIFLRPICLLFGVSETSLPYAMAHGSVIALGFPLIAILNPVTASVRVDGGATYGMVGLLVTCCSNIILDALFCLKFGWSVRGAAIATVIGELINVIWILAYIPRFKNVSLRKKYFRPNISVIRNIASLGISICILQLSFALIAVVSNNMLAIYGALSKYGMDITVAAMGITIKISNVAVNIVQGISSGSQPIMGYNYGAGKYERTKSTFQFTVITGTLFMGLATIIFQLCPMALISLFGSESDLYNELAVMCMRIFLMLCVGQTDCSIAPAFSFSPWENRCWHPSIPSRNRFSWCPLP